MTVGAPDTAVVIPARNEARRIRACIDAIAAQADGRTILHVVVNNTTDATAELARQRCRDLGIPARIVEATLAPGQGVGTARRIGADLALRHMPSLEYLLTSDADSVVAPDWIARSIAHLAEVDAVCGNIGPIEAETGSLRGMDHALATLEGRYRALVLRFYLLHAPERHSTATHHGEASGASLGFRAAAYSGVGGFSDIRSGEDRDIVRRLKQADLAVRHADDVLVRTSLRLRGRAPGGMSEALRARTSGDDYCIDECLPPADWLWRHRAALPIWPHDGSGYAAIPVRQLERHVARLEAMIAVAVCATRAQDRDAPPPFGDPCATPDATAIPPASDPSLPRHP